MAGSRIGWFRAPVAAAALAAVVLGAFWLPGLAQESGRAGTGRAAHAEWLDSGLDWTIRGIEIVGIAVIVIGAIAAAAGYLLSIAREGPTEAAYHGLRSGLGRAILLGLEFLVAADIINTVAIDPTLESVAVLGGIVLVRTFLSFALEVEIEGRLPWRRGEPRPPSPDS